VLTLALMVILAQAEAPASSATVVPRDVAAAVEMFAAVEQALAGPSPDAAALGVALEKVTKAEADRLIRESGVGEVDPVDRRALEDEISDLVGRRLRHALALAEPRRSSEVRVLARAATAGDLAVAALDRWLGFDERAARETAAAATPEAGLPQLSVASSGGELRVLPEGSRVVGEVGGAGAGNGFVDAGEWVELAVSIQNAGPRPWFSTSAYFKSESACVLAPAGGVEAPELPRGAIGALRAWLYFSRECTGAPRRIQVVFRDSQRAPSAEAMVVLAIAPLEMGFPRIANERFDTDELGSSDGSRRPDVGAARGFEFSSDLVASSALPSSARVAYLVPPELRPLFTSFSYRDEALAREDRVFRPADDLDGRVVRRDRFDRIIEATERSRRWVTARTAPRLWLAIDASFEVPRPGTRPASPALPPKTPPPLAPDVVASLARAFVSLAPHPVRPELKDAVSAASGLELVFDAKGFQAAYHEALYPSPRTLVDPCATGPSRPEPVEAPPLTYRYRLYHPLALAALTPPPPAPPAIPAPPPAPLPPPVARVEPPASPGTGTSIRVDLGTSYLAYGARAEARPELWGSKKAVEVASLRALVQVGTRPALLFGVAWGVDARTPEPESGQEHNLIETELAAGLGWTLSPVERLELVPNARVLLLHRSLKGAESAWTAGFETGGIARVRVAGRLSLVGDVAYRVAAGGPESASGTSLVDGNGFRVGGGISLGF
jgi:hypothetical protein